MTVSVVIPNWNGEKFLKKCLMSLKNQTYQNFEVIVVDNNSQDRSKIIVEELNISGLKWIALNDNYGFSKAVNVGINTAIGEYIFLLNNDTELHPNCLYAHISLIEKLPNAYALASLMIQDSKKDSIDSAGDLYSVFGIAYQRGNSKSINKYSKITRVFSACGGAAFYKKSIFDKIGLFDEDFFAYLEDVDIGFRARLKGYYSYYNPDAIVYHVGSGSTDKMSSLKVKNSVRNNIFVILKNMSLFFIFINLIPIIIGEFLKGIQFVRKGKLNELIQGYKEAFKSINQSRRKRIKSIRIKQKMAVQIELLYFGFLIVTDLLIRFVHRRIINIKGVQMKNER